MKKLNIHGRYDLSVAFVAAVKQTNDAVYPPIMRIDPVWRQASRAMKFNEQVASLVYDVFKVKRSGHIQSSSLSIMDDLAFSIRCKDIYPCCNALIAFDHLQMAYVAMPRADQLAMDTVFLALAGTRLQTFIESTPCSPAPAEALAPGPGIDGKGTILCQHTGMELSPEIYHKRFWVHCDTIDYVYPLSGDLDDAPEMDCKTNILGCFSALDVALDFLIDAANDDTAHKSCSYSLRYLHFTLLQGWITDSVLKWHKPGAEVDDVPDYFDERSGFDADELSRMLMDAEHARGYGSRTAVDFLLVDLGM